MQRRHAFLMAKQQAASRFRQRVDGILVPLKPSLAVDRVQRAVRLFVFLPKGIHASGQGRPLELGREVAHAALGCRLGHRPDVLCSGDVDADQGVHGDRCHEVVDHRADTALVEALLADLHADEQLRFLLRARAARIGTSVR